MKRSATVTLNSRLAITSTLAALCTLVLPSKLVAGEDLKPGLLVTEYPRHADQTDGEHAEMAPEKFGDPIGKTAVAESLTPWRHATERNAIARGYLRIDADGDYAFTSTNFYDRNLLMLGGEVVCGYRDGEDRVVTVPLKRGLVEIASVGFVMSRGASGVSVRWQPPGQRELSAIPPEKLLHHSNDLLAKWLTIVAKDFVIEAYKNGERIPDNRRSMLLDRYGASVERINVDVRQGDWLVFNVAHNRLRHGGTKFFAVAGCLDKNEFGFVSDPASEAWTVCDDPASVKEFIATRDINDLRDSSIGVERLARTIKKPWEEGMKFMRQYGGANFAGKPLWGKEASTWIKFTAPGWRSQPVVVSPRKAKVPPAAAAPTAKPTPPKLAVLDPQRWPVQIISATYGTGGKNADVTARVKEFVEDKRSFFAANPPHLGADPNPYWNKSLHIVYFKDGVRREQRRNENEHILAESFYGPQDAAELANWLVGTRWRGPEGEIQFQDDGVLTGLGVHPGAWWKALGSDRLRFSWRKSKDKAIEFKFDDVWRQFAVPGDGKHAYRLVE